MNIIKPFKTIGKVAYAHRADIAMATAAAALVAAIVDGCVKSTKNTPDILREHRDAVDKMKCNHVDKENMTKNEKKEYDGELFDIYRHTTWRMCKNYGLTIGFGMLSIGAGFYGYRVRMKENAELAKAVTTLSAAYTGLYDKFNKYRDNIVETYGEDADFKAMQNMHEEEVKVGNKKEKVFSNTTCRSDDFQEDAYMILDRGWGEFDEWDGRGNINNIKLRVGLMQSKLDDNAVDGITLEEFAKSLGVPEVRNMPYEWGILGYLPGDQIEYELDYNKDYTSVFLEGSGNHKNPAPPIEISFKNVALVASKIRPNDNFAKSTEELYMSKKYRDRVKASLDVENALAKEEE